MILSNAKEYLNLKAGRLSKSSIGVKGAIADLGISAFMGVKSGKSLGSALWSGAGEAALMAVAPGVMGAKIGADLTGMAIGGVYNTNRRMAEDYRKNTGTSPNFTYNDTRQALTMRQASVQAIQGSKMNARNALGGEASLMHRSNRVY